jgi:hypothetical protein
MPARPSRHNIVGEETGRPRPPVYMQGYRRLARGRRPAWPPAIWVASLLAACAALIFTFMD